MKQCGKRCNHWAEIEHQPHANLACLSTADVEHLFIRDASSAGHCLDTEFDSVHYSRDSNLHSVFGATIDMPACVSWHYM